MMRGQRHSVLDHDSQSGLFEGPAKSCRLCRRPRRTHSGGGKQVQVLPSNPTNETHGEGANGKGSGVWFRRVERASGQGTQSLINNESMGGRGGARKVKRVRAVVGVLEM